MSTADVVHPANSVIRSSPRAAPERAIPRRLVSWLRWVAPVILFGAAGLGVLRYSRAHAANPIHYETSTIDRGPLAAKVTATGALSALVTVSVGSQVSGRIETLGADFESAVKAGQTIATIEPSLFRAAVAQARANFASAKAAVEKARANQVNAESQFVRAKALLADSLLSKSDYDADEAALGAANADVVAAVAGVAQSKAALEQAELNLRYTTIISPIDGVVISRNVDIGQTVAATLQAPTLFTIAQDLTRMQVDTNVAEADVGKVRAGTDVTFTVDAYPTRTFRGTVRQVRDNAQTIQNVVTYDAVIDVDNTERLLKPSMTANATFVYATRDSAQRLPNGALRFKPDPSTLALMTGAFARTTASRGDMKADERIVWVLRASEAKPLVVRIGISDGASTEILGGDAREGDEAIIEAAATKHSP